MRQARGFRQTVGGGATHYVFNSGRQTDFVSGRNKQRVYFQLDPQHRANRIKSGIIAS